MKLLKTGSWILILSMVMMPNGVSYAGEVQVVDKKMPPYSGKVEAQAAAVVQAKNEVMAVQGVPQVVEGVAEIQYDDAENVVVVIHDENAIIHWDNFNVGGNLQIVYDAGNNNVLNYDLGNQQQPIVNNNVNGIIIGNVNWIQMSLVPKMDAVREKINAKTFNLANPADAQLAKEALDQVLAFQKAGSTFPQDWIDQLDKHIGNDYVEPATGKHVLNEADRHALTKRISKAQQPVILSASTYRRFLSKDGKNIIIPEYQTVKVVRPFTFNGGLVLSAHSTLIMEKGASLVLNNIAVHDTATIKNNDPRYDIPAISLRLLNVPIMKPKLVPNIPQALKPILVGYVPVEKKTK